MKTNSASVISNHLTNIDTLPKEWEIMSIKKISKKLRAGGTPRRGHPEYFNGDTPFVKIGDITNASIYLDKTNEAISEEGLEVSSAWIVPPNTVLLAMYGSIGKVTINKVPVATNQAIIAIKPKLNVYHEYLFYSLLYFGRYLERYNVQSTQKNINKGIVESFELPIPPLPEQHAIAHVLSTVRQAIDATEGVIAAAHELKRSMMKHLFSYGPVPVHEADQVPLKETEIGAVPDEWEVIRIEEITHELRNRNSELSYSRDDVLSVSNVLGFFPSDRSLGKDFSKYKIVKHRQFGYNPMRLNVGSIAFRHKKKTGIVSPDYIVFKANEEKVMPEYINQYRYTGNWWKQIQMSGQGSIRIRYYYRHIKEFFIPIPTLEVQSKVTTILELIDNKIQQEENRKIALEELFTSLLQDLMTGKVRVNSYHDS